MFWLSVSFLPSVEALRYLPATLELFGWLSRNTVSILTKFTEEGNLVTCGSYPRCLVHPTNFLTGGKSVLSLNGFWVAAEVERHRPGRNVGSAVPPGVHLWAPEVTGRGCIESPHLSGQWDSGLCWRRGRWERVEQTCADSRPLPWVDLPLWDGKPSEGHLAGWSQKRFRVKWRNGTTNRRCRASSGGPGTSWFAGYTPGQHLPWLSPWLCPWADSLSLGENMAFSSSDFDLSFLSSFTFFRLLPAGWSLWADNLAILAAGIRDSASVGSEWEARSSAQEDWTALLLLGFPGLP